MKKYVLLFLVLALVAGANLLFVPIASAPVQVVQYRVRAAFGDEIAQYRIGLIYAYGRGGLSRDDAKAVYFFRKAADKGYVDAQTELGYMYEGGRGVTLDKAQAVTWFRKAATQGNARAQNALGGAYDRGLGVPKDELQALYWYRLSAAQGDVWGMNDLAWLYVTSTNPEVRNPTAALEYALKAVKDTEYAPSPAILDTLAEAYYANEQYDDAVKTEQNALDLLPVSLPADKRAEYQERFDKYRRAKQKKKESGGKEQ